MAIAKFFAERPYYCCDKNPDGAELVAAKNGPNWIVAFPEATVKRAEQDYVRSGSCSDEDALIAEFRSKSEWERRVLCMYQWLMETNFSLDMTPVVFVRYDENLYRALKHLGAATRRKGRTGRVSLEPDALHQYL